MKTVNELVNTSIELKKIPIDEIIPYFKNARKNDPAVPVVMASIKKYGYCQPIVIDKNKVIVAGHTRYKALKKLGVSEVPCVTVDLSEKEAKEYRIVDNKTSEVAEWDEDLLLSELREFENLSEAQVFFPDENLEDLMKESMGQSQSDVVAGDVEKAAEKNVKFTAKPDQLEVSCPHCHEEFYLNRKDVLERE